MAIYYVNRLPIILLLPCHRSRGKEEGDFFKYELLGKHNSRHDGLRDKVLAE